MAALVNAFKKLFGLCAGAPETEEGSKNTMLAGARVRTPYGLGTVDQKRPNGTVVATLDWQLANAQPVKAFMPPKNSHMAGVVVSEVAETPYGAGDLVAARKSGTRVVVLSAWKLSDPKTGELSQAVRVYLPKAA
jgi:N-acetylmuramic acid 6-phosphate (MurNAc-6-P) etherase